MLDGAGIINFGMISQVCIFRLLIIHPKIILPLFFVIFFFKGIYSDKETKFEKKISLSVLTLLSNVKTKKKISSIFVALSENLNFIIQAIILLDK